MVRIAVCDDNFFYRKDLEQLCVEYYGRDCEITLFEDGQELIADIMQTRFDIVFLDIEMKRSNGIEVKMYLEENGISSAIIFITSSTSYMREAFGKNVYGFMEKPVQKEQLFHLLDRVHALSNFSKTLVIKDIHGKDRSLNTEDIHYIRGELNYTRIFLGAEESILVYCTLKKWMETLDTRLFVRIHKSFIVNLSHVESIDRQVHLAYSVLPVSKNKLKQVKQFYIAYLSRSVV